MRLLKYLTILLFIILFAGCCPSVGCVPITSSPIPTIISTTTSTIEYTTTPEVTIESTIESTIEASPTALPTATETLAPTPIPTIVSTKVLNLDDVYIDPDATNLLANPDFEGNARPVIFPEINVIEDWYPYYAASGYLDYKDNFPADRRDTHSPARNGYNEPNLILGRPEYKPTDVSNRVHHGKSAQQLFNNYRAHDGGVFQIIDVPLNVVCEVDAYVQSWSNAEGSTNTLSDLFTADDRDNYHWFIRVDASGYADAYADEVLTSRSFGYADGIYDKYVLIKYRFLTITEKATIFIGARTTWPMGNNNAYIDDAHVICSEPLATESTPEPTATPVILPTPNKTITPAPNSSYLDADQVYTVIEEGLNVHSDRNYFITSNIVYSYNKNDDISVKCVVIEGDVTWGSTDLCSPEPIHWFVLRIGTKKYADIATDPEGN